MNIRKYLLNKVSIYFALILFVLVPCFYYFVSFRTYPTLYFDEYYYLQGANLISQKGISGLMNIGYPYSPLYSAVLSLLVTSSDLCQLYPKALVLNAFFSVISTVPLYFLFRKYKTNIIASFLITLLVILSPSMIGYSMAAMSEGLFIAVYIFFSSYMLLREKITYRDFFIFPLFAALLVFTKKNGIGISLGFPVALIFLYYKKDTTRSILLSVFTFCVSFFSMQLITNVWHLDGANQSLGRYASLLSDFNFSYFLDAVFGQIGYIHIASGMLLPFALIFCLKKYKEGDKRPLALFICSIILMSSGILHMVVARISGSEAARYLMYGRYVDYFIPIVIFMGGQSIYELYKEKFEKKYYVPISLVVISLIFVFFLPNRIDSIHILNMGVGWIKSELSDRVSVLMIILFAVTITVLPFLKKYLRAFCLIIPFCLIISLHYASLKNIKEEYLFYQNKIVGQFVEKFSEVKLNNKKLAVKGGSLGRPEYIFMLRYYLNENLVEGSSDYTYSEKDGLVSLASGGTDNGKKDTQ